MPNAKRRPPPPRRKLDPLYIWVVMVIAACEIARRKGKEGREGWFLFCLVLAPIAIIVLLNLPRPPGVNGGAPPPPPQST